MLFFSNRDIREIAALEQHRATDKGVWQMGG
jgi:hypothetical protein